MAGERMPIAEMTEAQQARTRLARKELANFRQVVRRKHTTGWVHRSAKSNFRRAFAAVLAVEDLAGVEAARKLSDRLDEVRIEAMAAGLLSATEARAVELEVINVAAAVQAEREIALTASAEHADHKRQDPEGGNES